tara:strand:- start:107 stop:475 length:369 start_codon:yes stop_codon:yes gene_type:complete
MVNIVRGFITARPELATNDVQLIYAVWAWQLKNNKPNIDIKKMTARELMKKWRDGGVSSAFNISRSRRKCQQHYPETRGKNYVSKQKHQDTIKNDVKRSVNISDREPSKGSDKNSLKGPEIL